MKLLTQIRRNAELHPDRIAYITAISHETGYQLEKLSWGEVNDKSDRLASYLSSHLKTKKPIIVFGHKSPYMVVLFLSCVKSGRAYVPVESSFPNGRIQDICQIVEPELILTTEPLNGIEGDFEILDLEKIKDIIDQTESLIDSSAWVKPENVYYIIFTSGSTGTPKGVQITASCLDNFISWAVTLGEKYHINDGLHHTFINQAPFSFDLSVMDLYLSLYTGGTLWAIPKFLQKDMEQMYAYIGDSGADVWVSTPSFAEMAFMDESFAESLLPQMRLFLFCGETLTNQTVTKLNNAFPRAEVFNTYGPTESTVAITSVYISEKIKNAYNPLPIGTTKPGTWVYIMDENNQILPDGEKGEIVIVGDSVSIGYWKNPSKNAEMFDTMQIDGNTYRLYHTHDKGYYQNGQLFYCGRIDLQIKMHGYRIELEDIESNLLACENVERAVILPNIQDGEITSLSAFVVPKQSICSTLKERQRLRTELKKRLPEYMIPKKFVFRESLPVTTNGKVDRKKLEAEEKC